jgi:hypothetical protein
MPDIAPAPPQRERPPLDLVDLLKYIGSPLAVGTALLFYFGWVRSNEQAELFGADISVFEMSPDDFVLRSVNVVFWALLALLLLGLLFLRIQPWLRDHAGPASRVLLFSWLLIPVGLVVLALSPFVGTMLLPIVVLIAVAGTAYGARLRRHGRGEGPPPLAQDLLVGALLVVLAFWATERVARAVGDSLTHEFQRGLATEPSLSLYSEGQLHITSPGVTETVLVGEDGRYAYRYDGLYLVQRSGDKYFLVSNAWESGQWAGRLVVLPDDGTVRLEFTPRAPL